MVLWFNLTTFDVIGSLAFGESFGGLKLGQCVNDTPGMFLLIFLYR